MFMTEKELYYLTGYKIPSKQRKQLAKMGVDFLVGRDDKPVVSKLAINNMLEGEKRKTQTSPNFDALNND